MRPKFMLLQKSAAVEDEDGALTPTGMAVAERYARRWVADGVRDLEVERQYPTLAGLFYDIRSDPDLAREHASEEKPVRKSMDEQIVMVRPEIQTLTVAKLIKAQPYYTGPRGGKWADPQLTIPWKEGGEKKPKAAEEEGQKPKGMIQIEHKHIPLGKRPEHKGPRKWVEHYEGLPDQTVHAYSMPSAPGQPRQYVPERAQMHEAIIADAFRGKHPVPEGQKPVAILMMGGGASGKSTLVRKQFEEKGLLGNFVQINSDDVKEQLPEYDIATKDPNNTAKDAAAMVHEESSDIAKEMAARAFGNPQAKYNFVFDGTGANARKYGEMIDKLKERGYHVHLMYADVENPDDAWRRSSSRADKTGRWVPEEMLRHAHASIPQNFEELAGKVDSYGMYQLPKEGGHTEVMSGQGGRHDVQNPEYLASFRARAEKLREQEAGKAAPWQTKQAPAGGQPPAPAGGTMPSKPVAKSMTARYTDSEMRKAFPQPPQQKPNERFVMNRPPQPGAPAGAPDG